MSIFTLNQRLAMISTFCMNPTSLWRTTFMVNSLPAVFIIKIAASYVHDSNDFPLIEMILNGFLQQKDFLLLRTYRLAYSRPSLRLRMRARLECTDRLLWVKSPFPTSSWFRVALHLVAESASFVVFSSLGRNSPPPTLPLQSSPFPFVCSVASV